jgi:hypothetical protein
VGAGAPNQGRTGRAAIGVGQLVLFALPFEAARALVDPIAKDGSLDLFSQPLYAALRWPGLAIGILLLAAAGAMLVMRRQSLYVLGIALRLPVRFFARLSADGRIFGSDLHLLGLLRSERILLGGLVLLAAAARIVFIMRPFAHDEAYTVSVLVASPLHESLSDYYLPNNHLFHTFLAHISYLFFGYQQWAMRLPAFLAGVLAHTA